MVHHWTNEAGLANPSRSSLQAVTIQVWGSLRKALPTPMGPRLWFLSWPQSCQHHSLRTSHTQGFLCSSHLVLCPCLEANEPHGLKLLKSGGKMSSPLSRLCQAVSCGTKALGKALSFQEPA